jgi:hypothetical protein
MLTGGIILLIFVGIIFLAIYNKNSTKITENVHPTEGSGDNTCIFCTDEYDNCGEYYVREGETCETLGYVECVPTNYT